MIPSAVKVAHSSRVRHVIVGPLVEVGHLVLLLLDEVVVLLHQKVILDGELLIPVRLKPSVWFLDVHIVSCFLLGVLADRRILMCCLPLLDFI